MVLNLSRIDLYQNYIRSALNVISIGSPSFCKYEQKFKDILQKVSI